MDEVQSLALALEELRIEESSYDNIYSKVKDKLFAFNPVLDKMIQS